MVRTSQSFSFRSIFSLNLFFSNTMSLCTFSLFLLYHFYFSHTLSYLNSLIFCCVFLLPSHPSHLLLMLFPLVSPLSYNLFPLLLLICDFRLLYLSLPLHLWDSFYSLYVHLFISRPSLFLLLTRSPYSLSPSNLSFSSSSFSVTLTLSSF